MELTTLTFLVFCIITLIIYFAIPKKFQWVTLFISSVIFLFWDNFNITTVIQALMVLVPTYILGRMIEKYYFRYCYHFSTTSLLKVYKLIFNNSKSYIKLI